MAVTRLDTAASADSTGTMTFAVSAGTDRCLIVSTGREVSGDSSVTGIDYGGQTMVEAVQQNTGTSGFTQGCSIWYLLDDEIAAASGTTITVTYNLSPADQQIHAISYEGVDQTGGATTVPQTNTASTTASTPNPLISDITETDEGCVVGIRGCGNNTTHTWGGTAPNLGEQTDQSDASSSSSMADRLSTTNGNVNVEGTAASQNRGAQVVAALAPAPASPEIPVPIGNIDTDGLAPSSEIEHNRAVPVGNVDTQGLLPGIAITIGVPTGSLSIDGLAPTAEITHTRQIPTVTELTLDPLVPSAEITHVRDPPQGELSLTGLLPTIDVDSGSFVIDVPNTELHLVTFVGLFLNGQAPTISIEQQSVTEEPGAGSLLLTGLAPTAEREHIRQVPAGSLLLTGLVPTAEKEHTRQVPVGGLSFEGLLPTIDVTADVVIEVPQANPRTNLCLQSEDFRTTWGPINVRDNVDTVNVAVAPDGTTTADRIIDDSSTGSDVAGYGQNITFAATTTYTYSIFLKEEQLDWAFMEVINLTGLTINKYFDLGNGVEGGAQGDGVDSTTMESVGDGWYRCSITFTTAADTSGTVRVFPATSNGVAAVDLDGTSSILVWGAQLELGVGPTRYIKTVASAVTEYGLGFNTFDYHPSAEITHNRSVPVGNLSLAGEIPVTDTGENKVVQPQLGSLILAGLVPTAEITHTRAVPVGSLVFTGLVPSAETDHIRMVPAGTLTFTGYAPALVGAGEILVPDGALSLTGLAPRAQLTIDKGLLTLAGKTPAIEIIINNAESSLFFTGLAPTPLQNETPPSTTRSPGVGSLTLTGYTPSRPVGLLLKGFAPEVFGTVAISTETGTATLTGYAPDILTDNVITVPTGAMNFTVYQPLLPDFVAPGTGSLTLTGLQPHFEGPQVVNPNTGTLVLTGLVPTVSRSDEEPEVEAPSGGHGWRNQYDAQVQRRRGRRRVRRKRRKELAAIEDKVDREIARYFRKDAERAERDQEVAEMRAIVISRQDAALFAELDEALGDYYLRAQRKGTFSAVEAFERKLEEIIEEEEFLLLALLSL